MNIGEPRAAAYLARNIIKEGTLYLPTEIIRGLADFSQLLLNEHEHTACTSLFVIFSEQSLPMAAESRYKSTWSEDLFHAFTAFIVILSGTKWAPAEQLRQKIVWYLMRHR